MVQLRILAGKNTGTVQIIKRFPCVIGRGREAHWRLEEKGIWDRHLQVDFKRGEGIIIETLPGALATLNREPLERAVLHNGDIIEAGAAKLQFWLAATRQRSFRFREAMTWVALAILCVVQILVIYGLLR